MSSNSIPNSISNTNKNNDFPFQKESFKERKPPEGQIANEEAIPLSNKTSDDFTKFFSIIPQKNSPEDKIEEEEGKEAIRQQISFSNHSAFNPPLKRKTERFENKEPIFPHFIVEEEESSFDAYNIDAFSEERLPNYL